MKTIFSDTELKHLAYVIIYLLIAEAGCLVGSSAEQRWQLTARFVSYDLRQGCFVGDKRPVR